MAFTAFVFLTICLGLCTGQAPLPPYGHHYHNISVTFGDHLPDNPPFIVGGSDTNPGDFPWQISLQVRQGVGRWYHTCGGTIVDPTHVVCAAHCVNTQTPGNLDVVAGAYNVNDASEVSQQRVAIRRIVYHPRYNGNTFTHDVSVITLATPLRFNDRVRPLRLPPTIGREPTGVAINTGWGNTNGQGEPHTVPYVLQRLDLNIIDRNECRRQWAGGPNIDQSMICAGNGDGTSVCSGDSGGPLVCQDIQDGQGPYLCGIVSWGENPCGQRRLPSVFANPAFRPLSEFIANART